MATPFETLLDELEHADSRRRMAKALRHNAGFNPKRQQDTKRQIAKALGDLRGLQRKTAKEARMSKAMQLRELYAAARAEMAGAIGRLPATEISAMEARLARAGEQLHAAGIL